MPLQYIKEAVFPSSLEYHTSEIEFPNTNNQLFKPPFPSPKSHSICLTLITPSVTMSGCSPETACGVRTASTSLGCRTTVKLSCTRMALQHGRTPASSAMM